MHHAYLNESYEYTSIVESFLILIKLPTRENDNSVGIPLGL